VDEPKFLELRSGDGQTKSRLSVVVKQADHSALLFTNGNTSMVLNLSGGNRIIRSRVGG
jgi:hypothetical protein